MKKFILENKNLIILWILCGIALFIFCGHYNNILVEIGKELYYPERILDGKVLYKDLFLPNMPFSYLFNALLYKIFSPNLAVLYASGIICSFAIVSGIYITAKKFLSEKLSFILGFFTIVCGICTTHMFNYTLPYSFGMLYGTVGLIYSLYALIKFKEENKTQYLYLAALLGGFCFSNSLDFGLYALFLLITAALTKNKKIILNSITCFMIVPLICALILFLQKLGISDGISAVKTAVDFYTTKNIYHFYKVQGIIFTPNLLKFWGLSLLQMLLFGGAFWASFKLTEKNKIAGWFLTGIFSVTLFIFASPMTLILLVPITILMAIFCSQKIKENKALVFFIIGVLSACTKSCFMLLIMNYGNYIIPLVLCSVLAILFSVINKKYETIIMVIIAVLSINFLSVSVKDRGYLNTKIATKKGIIYTYENNAKSAQQLISKIQSNGIDKIIIYPEGLTINFLSGVKSDDYYNSLTPAIIETFGETTIIENLEETEPEYIVINNLKLKEYGTGEICDEYAFLFKDYLFENYFQIENIDNGFWYIVFKAKQKI